MTETNPPTKKPGRPRKIEPAAKRPTMAFRMSSSLHEQITAAAKENECSISEEIERRLDASFKEREVANKISNSLFDKLKQDWFGSRAMFDNALVYSKLLNRFIDTKLTLEQYKANKARAKEVLLAAHKDLIDHLFMALAHQKEFEAVWEPHDAEGTSGTTSVREMFLMIRMSAIQTQVLSHLMLEEHTPDELEWDDEEKEGTGEDKRS